MPFPWTFGGELEERVESGADFGNVAGYFVRLSVIRDDGGTEWVSLTPDEAELLANQLREAAAKTRENQSRHQRRPPATSPG